MKQIGTHNFFSTVSQRTPRRIRTTYHTIFLSTCHSIDSSGNRCFGRLLSLRESISAHFSSTPREFLLHSPKIHSISTLSKLEREHIVASDYFAPNIGNMKRRNRNDTLQIDSTPMFAFDNLRSTMSTLFLESNTTRS